MSGVQLLVNGDGPAVEYAVRMHQFDQYQRLNLQLDANRLSANDMDDLANNYCAAASVSERHGARRAR
ncbi:MAG: hypothetical protein IIC61_11880 [Proteobacteria bacterium]|nr:hypothetical protein [Pseudomonadota bacterium]